MKYHCKICDIKFKKFVLFEGHFDFNAKCREKHSCFLECYICSQEFRHSAALKYHLQQHRHQHTTKYVNKIQKIRIIPKITLKKQWNFKIISPIKDDEETKDSRLECKICRKTYRSIFYLEQHLIMHQKKRFIRSRRANINGISKYVPNVQIKSTIASNVHRNKSPLKPSKCLKCSICKVQVGHGERMGNTSFFFIYLNSSYCSS